MSCFLSNSSLGKKLVMSITGCFLVLFILFHMSMNITAIISPEGYNAICEFLGANWYALAGTLVLAAGVVVHFIYAVVLTLENYKARGSQRYAVTVKEPNVSWASKNMLVLGFIILGGRTPRTSTAAPTGSIRYRPRRECERIGSGARMTPFCEDGNRDFEHCELRSFNASPTIAAQHSARKPDWRSFSGLRPARRKGGKDRRLFLQSAARSPNGCARKLRRPAHRLQRGHSTRDRLRCPDTCRRA